MPPSKHDLRTHGPIIVKKAALSIGNLSEKAPKAENKNTTRYRQNHTRKISSEKINKNFFFVLILNFYSYGSSFTISHKPSKNIVEDMLELIINNDQED